MCHVCEWVSAWVGPRRSSEADVSSPASSRNKVTFPWRFCSLPISPLFYCCTVHAINC
jgi:hypothetical protein